MRKYLNAKLLSIFFFFFICFIGIIQQQHLADQKSKSDYEQAQIATDIFALSVKSQVEDIFSLANNLSAQYSSNRAFFSENFNDIADKAAITININVKSIQMTEGFIINKVWPLKGNEKALKLNIKNRPEVLFDFNNSIETEFPSISAPITLIQGGKGVIVRSPAFEYKNKNKTFIGMAQVVVLQEEIFKSTNDLFLKNNNLNKYTCTVKANEHSNGYTLFGKESEYLFFDKLAPKSIIKLPLNEWLVSCSTNTHPNYNQFYLFLLWGALACMTSIAIYFYNSFTHVKSFLNKEIGNEKSVKEVYSNLSDCVFFADKNGNIFWQNNSANSLADGLGNKIISIFNHKEIEKSLKNGHSWQGEVFVDNKIQGEVLVKIFPLLKSNTIYRWVIVVKNVNDQFKIQDEIKNYLQKDSLTGLPNRELFLEKLNQALLEHKRSNKPFSVLFIDLDVFKPINDNYGHRVGDLALTICANRIKNACRQSDICARFGGDEFVVLIRECSDGTNSAIVAQKIITSISEPFNIESHNISLGASVGISLYPHDGADADILINAADMAMYKVKGQNKNSFGFATTLPLKIIKND